MLISFYDKIIPCNVTQPLPTYRALSVHRDCLPRPTERKRQRKTNGTMKVDDGTSWPMILMFSCVIVSSHRERANSWSLTKCYFFPHNSDNGLYVGFWKMIHLTGKFISQFEKIGQWKKRYSCFDHFLCFGKSRF